MASTRGTRGRRTGRAGRAPVAGRDNSLQGKRSRAALPARAPKPVRPVDRRRRTTLTARAAVLAVAVASVALAVALPFKIWLAQRGEIAQLEAQTRAQRQHVAQLQSQQQQWTDPTFIEQQARARLHYVMPGQKTYVYLGPKPAAHPPTKTSSSTPNVTGAWYSRLWQTVQLAGK